MTIYGIYEGGERMGVAYSDDLPYWGGLFEPLPDDALEQLPDGRFELLPSGSLLWRHGDQRAILVPEGHR